MRVCYLVMQWPKDSEAFIAVDIRALLHAGHEITVKSFRPAPGDADGTLASRGLESLPRTHPVPRDWAALFRHPRLTLWLVSFIFHSKPPKVMHWVKSLALLPRIVRIIQEIRREAPEVVHAFWGHYPALALAGLSRFKDWRPLITTSLLAYDLEMRYAPGLRVAREIADTTFTHAEANRSTLAGLGVPQDRITVIRAGVDPRWLTRPIPKQAFSHRSIVTTGRLIESKGHNDLIRAFAALREGRRDVRLLILGSGPFERELRRLAERLGVADAVELSGHVSHEDVRIALHQADIFVLMSRYKGERLPNAVKEAMACGLPCVVARSPGMDELVLNGETGWILEPGDWRGLATKLKKLINDETTRRSMGEAARNWVLREYNADTQQARYVDAWRAKLSASKNGAHT
ncbi:MAG: glycosyltransferase family 4 protein [Elusimicrobia bacterium]|nr:glycosyltransferase family 4 protein [Elusimicrobiota bacterium]